MEYFDCDIVGGDPTGRTIRSTTGIPQPAQAEVIPSVVAEKQAQLKSGTELSINVWRSRQEKYISWMASIVLWLVALRRQKYG